MKLRMQENEQRFDLSLLDASRRYKFWMKDKDVFEIIHSSSQAHEVVVAKENGSYILDTDASQIFTWLQNNETVILYDPEQSIYAMLRLNHDEVMCADGLNYDACIMRQYTIPAHTGTAVTVITNGPMTEEEILMAVTAGWV